ncbi:jacalin-like lectin [Streptomyces turgidiscabies]|uniref:Jacalin-like lectin domain protein n=1 Tax=Streptomyces turgidiscabies (strain Car8) TaxID=698760 RepID=L7ERG2_STRT8|nr:MULTISPECIES: jacalin-like lectin [Streptomyces]ELP61311.1 jacalin-like lectin domain protein [Streptomyces turgidiscabies Car8]MDX3494992.1 jacalin-like lectin [Streptomyces turgidiscabies]GAQ70864.1 Jacalin-like lectin domain protein [Streptomyces turgidiscabies]
MRRLIGTLVAGALALAGLAATGSTPAAAATSGTFNVLTYNVAGLPGIVSSGNPEVNTPLISPRLGAYDIVNVQEDFNYHAALYANDNHPYRTATSGGAAFGDGLNTLSDYAFQDFERVKWNKCTGTNCLTPKGFSLARVRIAEGVYVDLYNVHTNADDTDEAHAARRDNVSQLSAFIKANSSGNAVIVMGDTNTRYTRAGDNIRTLASENGLTDAWVQLVKGGTPPVQGADPLLCPTTAPTNNCEVVDKVFYRGSKLVNLSATRYNNEWASFLDSAGGNLSDHFPHTVDFSWTVASKLRASDFLGGEHGTAFSDADDLPATPSPRTLTLRGSSRLDAVSLAHDGGTTLTHGGTGGTATSLTLASGEHLTSVKLTQGQKDGRTRIFSAAFTTDKARTLTSGTATTSTATFTAPSGWQIVGFTGRSGDEIDKLGVVYAPIA